MDPQNLNSVDEDLVAAYVDGEVTTEERQRVEAAMAASEQVAWEVNTLRQTVELLQDLPSVPLPRSFTLTEDQVADVLQERRSLAKVNPSPPREIETPQDSAWQRLLRFLNGGDLALRNAAALAAVLLLLVFVAETQLQNTQFGPPSGDGEQLSNAPAVPQAQVTAVGGSLSQQTDSSADETKSDEQLAEDGSGQDDEDGVIGIMSTGEEDQQSAGTEEEPVAAAMSQPETSSAAAESSQQQLSSGESADPSGQPLVTILRYARILLVLAVIVLWLLSRTRSRRGRA